ncbi:MAG: SDR family oxidoreductase [Rhizobiales bacterium]|nr:SDR family oxidoreductase [Hyphomicrobiales bacterium]
MTRSIVITGGSRGIGAATARLAGKEGWSVTFSYIGNEKAAKETAAAVEAAGGKALAVKSDASVEKDIIALFDAATKAFGPIDGVVNNAGIVGVTAKLADMDYERIKRIVDINVTGAFLVAREAVRRMAKGRGGRGGSLVNISSAAVKLGAPNTYVDYAAGKGAIETLTLGLSREVGPDGIRVSAVRPGVILTDIHASGGAPDRPHQIGATTPLGRPGTAEEVAEAVVWLLGDKSSYVAGAVVDVTGGR